MIGFVLEYYFARNIYKYTQIINHLDMFLEYYLPIDMIVRHIILMNVFIPTKYR